MNTEGRKIIFECVTGSHLYGTSNENSDQDFTGIFLPSANDLLGLQNPPSEWAMNEHKTDGPRNGAGDVDRKYYSLSKWLKMVADGQSWAVEMLFAPDDKVTVTSPEWGVIKAQAKLLISKKSVAGVVGFSMAQSHKASIKGENLKTVRDCISVFKSYAGTDYRNDKGRKIKIKDVLLHDKGFPSKVSLKSLSKDLIAYPEFVNQGGTGMIAIAGRRFDIGMDIKRCMANLELMEEKYGTRSEAAAKDGVEWKSLYHAYRLTYEAIELLDTGVITLPRPKGERRFLMMIRNKEYEANYREELQGLLKEIDEKHKPESKLPDKPAWSKINQLCMDLMRAHLT